MSKKITLAVAVIMVMCVALLSFFGCGKDDQTGADTTAATSSVPESGVEETAATVADVTGVSDTATPETAASQAAEATAASETAASQAAEATAASETAASAAGKKGVIYKVAGNSKIWANTVGQAYILFKDIDTPNEWGEKGKVYELYVAQFGDNYSMWSDGYWSIDESTGSLKLTPKNQSENGNIGVDAGKTKTIAAENGAYVIDIAFSSGGKTTMTLKP